MIARKHGFSLIEMVVAVAVLSVAMTVTVTIVHRMLHEQRSAHQALDRHLKIQRLGDQLTRDVHAAVAVEWIADDGADGWQVQLRLAPQRVIDLQCSEIRLDRVEIVDDVAVHREQFMLPSRCRLAAVPDPDDARFLRCEVWQELESLGAVKKLLSRRRIWVGRDRRHEVAAVAEGIDP